MDARDKDRTGKVSVYNMSDCDFMPQPLIICVVDGGSWRGR